MKLIYGMIFLWISSVIGDGICDPSLNERNVCNNGICKDIENNGYYVCICNERYLGEYCEIEQKSRLTAFLLELCLGYFFGAGGLYIGRILPSVIKISLSLIMIFTLFYRPFGIPKTPEVEKRRKLFIINMILINLILFTWWILDMIYIGAGYYKDMSIGRGISLYNDFNQ